MSNSINLRFISHGKVCQSMALKAAIILTGISIGLLIIYGADVAAGQATDEGFLPFDAKTRGIGLGMPALILPIIGYFISTKNPSMTLGVLLIISGILTAGGVASSLVMGGTIESTDGTGRNLIAEFVPVIAVGIFIIVLGAIKIKKSR